MGPSSKELGVKDLRSECDPALFGFESTDEVSDGFEIIGQDRAIKAIDFALNIDTEGFNLYISGASGTGRNTAVLKAVEEAARTRKTPDDICYLYNFIKPDEPKMLKLPAGAGCALRRDIEVFVNDLEKEIKKAFSSEDYDKHKKAVASRFEAEKEGFESELDEYVRQKGFTMQQTLTGLVAVPIYKGHPIKEAEYDKLSDEERSAMKKGENEVYEKLYEVSRKMRDLEKELKAEMKKLDEKVGLYAIGHMIDELKGKYKASPEVTRHLDEVRDDILKNLDELKKESDSREMPFLAGAYAKEKEAILNRYGVNLIVDNCNAKGAPVVVETNPTYYNITGYVEYRAQFGVLTTDFTMIKAGSALKADGGFLIIQADQILRDYFSWDSLKKILRYKQVKIENLGERYGFMPTAGLKPEAAPVEVKVIMIGSPMLYYLLYTYEEEFRKLFNVKADFDSNIKKSDEFTKHYALFVARKCKEEKTMPFNKEAVAGIIDYSTRMVSHKDKLSIRFREVTDMIRQADYWARKDAAKMVEAKHVKSAIEEKIYRSNMIEKKIQEMFEEGTLFVETDGVRIGQINGLSVIQLGDYAFGMPSRITARTFLGKGNIINIEREVKMSGKIHSKGMLILSGYLGHKFAQDKPLALSASIGFEQSYEGVEGDSASSTELYCLLSSISEVPLRQDIAVTGSVDQGGKVQPIGGVNEKVEGFYEICKIKGMTGSQGVMIPRTNIKHLMLKDEVVEAVKNGKFHIYAVDSIEEGIEVLTGISKDAVFGKVNDKLAEYARIAAKGEKEEK